MTKRYLKMPDRFWQYVHRCGPDECWPWVGPVLTVDGAKSGYGVFVMSEGGKRVCTTAHKRAFLLGGGVLPEGHIVRHSCDNPPCCNPAHLLSGTHKDNHDDMVARGRARWQSGRRYKKGWTHGKLTDSQVIEIRQLREAGKRPWEIGPKFDISEKYVSSICSGRRKAHVTA